MEPWRRLASWPALGLLVAAVYGASVVDMGSNDPAFVPLTAHSLVHEHDLDLDEYPSDLLLGHPLSVRGDGTLDGQVHDDPTELDRVRDGRDPDLADFFPWVTALFATPVILSVDAKAAVFGGADALALVESGSMTRLMVLVASLMVAISAVFVRAIAVRMVTGSPLRRRVLATAVALVFAFGTSAWSTASRAMWQHTVALPFVAAALWAVLRLAEPTDDDDPAPPWLGLGAGAAMAFAVAARPTNALLAMLIAVWLATVQRRHAGRYVAGGAAVAAVFVGANLVLAGVALPPYYEGSRVRWHADFPEAFAAQWISPNRGLLFASPILLLAVPGAVVLWRRGLATLAACLTAAAAGVSLSAAGYEHWWGGQAFGPRIMTEAVLPLVVLAIPAVDRLQADRRWLAVGGLAAWSVLFHGVGAESRVASCWNVQPVLVDSQPERVWSLTDSHLALAARTLEESPRQFLLGPCEPPGQAGATSTGMPLSTDVPDTGSISSSSASTLVLTPA